jgi:hypothetical protein
MCGDAGAAGWAAVASSACGAAAYGSGTRKRGGPAYSRRRRRPSHYCRRSRARIKPVTKPLSKPQAEAKTKAQTKSLLSLGLNLFVEAARLTPRLTSH